MNPYEDPSTPELDDLQQNNEREAPIEVPVRVVDIGPVQVHSLPARDAVMRSVTAVVGAGVMQLVGKDLRRSRIVVWAQGEADGDFIYIGVDKNEVESGTAAQMLAAVAGGLEPAILLDMSHAMPLWVRNSGVNPVTVSFLAEYWAD